MIFAKADIASFQIRESVTPELIRIGILKTAYAQLYPEQYDQMPFQDQIRSGNEQGLLLGDWPEWRAHREMRNKTSHTYDEEVALTVVAQIPAFLSEAIYFRNQLEKRLA